MARTEVICTARIMDPVSDDDFDGYFDAVMNTLLDAEVFGPGGQR